MVAVVLLVAALLTAALSGILGMAGGMLLMGVAAGLLPVSAAMVFHGTTQAVSNASRAVVLVRRVQWRIAARHAAGALAAFAVVRLVAFRPDEAVVLLALGSVPFAARLLPSALSLDATRPRSAVACGFVTTAVQLIAGVSGPLLDAWYARAPLDRREVVATKAATQVTSHGLKVAHFGALAATAGDATVPAWWLAGATVAALAGTWAGTRLLDRMPEETFRRLTRRVVLALGAACLLQGVAALAEGAIGTP